MIIIYLLVELYAFFILYVASMAMVRAHKEHKLNTLLWILCVPFVAFSLIIDIANKFTVFTVLFFEFPKELTVTERLKRHVKQNTVRGRLARYIGDNLLNSFDPSGNHLD